MANIAKVPFTVRVLPESLECLQRLATERNQTMSKLANMAIDEYLATQNTDPIAKINHNNVKVFLDVDDMRRVTPVVEAFGAPMPLSLFVQVLLAQRSE